MRSKRIKLKHFFLESICKKNKLKPEEIVFVGDSSNDLPAFEFTGRGILVGAGNDKLKKAAWKHVQHIKDIIPILT